MRTGRTQHTLAQGVRRALVGRTGLRCGVCRYGMKAENVESRLERHNSPPSRYVGRSELKSFQFSNRDCLAPNAFGFAVL